MSTETKKETKWGSVMLGLLILWVGTVVAGMVVILTVQVWIQFWHATASLFPTP